MDRSVYFRFKAMELQVYCIAGQKITIWMIIFTGRVVNRSRNTSFVNSFINGGWAVLETLDSFINHLVKKKWELMFKCF